MMFSQRIGNGEILHFISEENEGWGVAGVEEVLKAAIPANYSDYLLPFYKRVSHFMLDDDKLWVEWDQDGDLKLIKLEVEGIKTEFTSQLDFWLSEPFRQNYEVLTSKSDNYMNSNLL